MLPGCRNPAPTERDLSLKVVKKSSRVPPGSGRTDRFTCGGIEQCRSTIARHELSEAPPPNSRFGCVFATLVRQPADRQCSRKFPTGHAAHVTRTPHAGNPISANARTDSRAVAPVVSTSSTTTTSAFPGIPRSAARSGTVTRPPRLSARSAGVKPTESRTPRPTCNRDTTRLSGSHRVAKRAERSTGSPPLRRAATALLGAGTSTSGRPADRSSASPPASAAPSGSARSRRPRSFAASTARRAGPAYGASAQHGTPGSVRGHTRSGGPASAAAHSAHHPEPGRPQPAQAAGRTRSSRFRIARVCTWPPTRSAPLPTSPPDARPCAEPFRHIPAPDCRRRTCRLISHAHG